VVPFFIVIGMALPATKAVVAMKDTTNADITIKATGYQWKWGYDYLKGEGEGIGFLSTLDASHRAMSDSGKPEGDNYLLKVDNPLVVPVDKKIRIITTANDVIHAWMVPAFGVKQDAIPGFVRDTWFRAEKTGDFYGQCAELCGKEHAYMPIHVKVLSQADYAKWVTARRRNAMRPRRTTRPRCGSWRTWWPAARRSMPPTARPATGRRQGCRPDQGARRQRHRARVPTRRSRSQILLNGAAGGAMPAWKQLSDTEIAAVITYTRNVEQQDRPAGAACPGRCRAQVIRFKEPDHERSPRSRPRARPRRHDDHAHDHPHGWRRWLFATNHKDIGTMYLLFSFTMLMIGGILALGIRLELFQPGLQFVNPELFNQFTTMHGLIMVFGAIMPAFVGFANWMIPLQIGAADMAFARMNNLSFWLLIPAALMLAGSFFMPGGAPAAGWTLYAPLTLQMGPSMDAGIFAMHIMGASSIMGSINIIVTVLNMRAPGMTLMKMPLFCWTWLITAYLLIAVMPVLAGAITMTLTDRHFGTSFFNAGRRRRPDHVPAHLLVLRAPRGLHHDPAGLRHRQRHHPGVCAQEAVRLHVDGLCHGLDRDPVVHRVGAPHVHHRHAGDGAAVLHVRHDADRHARPA
jgi:heme/copper-type cytochrome/quinol oxidase subunit 2